MPFVTLTSCICVFVRVRLRQTSHSHVPHCVWLGRSDCHFLSSSRLISSLPLSVTQVKPIQKPLLSHPLLASLKDCFLMQIMKRTFHPASRSIYGALHPWSYWAIYVLILHHSQGSHLCHSSTERLRVMNMPEHVWMDTRETAIVGISMFALFCRAVICCFSLMVVS